MGFVLRKSVQTNKIIKFSLFQRMNVLLGWLLLHPPLPTQQVSVFSPKLLFVSPFLNNVVFPFLGLFDF